MNKITLFAILFVGGSLLSGCASAPTEEVTAAQTALQQAQEAQADLYVADLFQAAQDSLTAAQAEIEAENGEFAMSRNYDHATELLSFVTQTATEAQAQVEERKEMMRTDAEAMIAQAQQTLDSAQTLIAQAPTGQESKMALVSITQNTGSAQTMLNEAKTALEQNDIATAYSKSQTALDQANLLVSELQAALAKIQS